MAEWIDSKKQNILENSGFFYDLDKMIYFNTREKKVFSFQALSDHPIDWLKSKLLEQNAGREWKFYFNSPPEDDVKERIKKYLERTN